MDYFTEAKLSREAQNGKIIISLLIEYYSTLRKSLEQRKVIREKLFFVSILMIFILGLILKLYLTYGLQFQDSLGMFLFIGLVIGLWFLCLSLVKVRGIERKINLHALQLEEIIKVVYEVLEHTNQEDFGVKLEMKIRLAEGIDALEKANYVRNRVIGNGKWVVVSNSLNKCF